MFNAVVCKIQANKRSLEVGRLIDIWKPSIEDVSHYKIASCLVMGGVLSRPLS